MFIDAFNTFSDAQALTASAASTNVIDLGADRNIGIGEPMAVLITVDVAADGTTGDETYTAKLQTDSAEGFGTASDVTVAISIPRTTSVAGTKFVIPVPPNTDTKRYLRVYYTLGGTTPTLTVTAVLVPMKFLPTGENVYYPDAITIS